MTCLKIKIEEETIEYQITDSYRFNENHNAESYLKSIVTILKFFDLIDGVSLSGYIQNEDNFIATFIRKYPEGRDIVCQIDYQTTTLKITAKE